MAARNRKGLSENTRKRIQTTMLAERLTKHVLGEVEMSATQVRAAEILLNKTLPNLSSVEAVQEVIHRNASELSDAELANIATGSSTGAAEQANSKEELH